MDKKIFAYVVHDQHTADETTLEMITAAESVDPNTKVTALVFGSGTGLDQICAQLTGSYADIWKVDHEILSYPDAEIIRRLLARIIPQGSIALLPHDHFGIDLGPGLSVALGATYVSDIVGFEGIEAGLFKAIRQEYNGLVSTHVDCDISEGAVITIRPGSFKAVEGREVNGTVTDKTLEAMGGGVPETGRRLLEVIREDTCEVDICQADILVSVGRGIEDQENLDMVYELAEALGGEVSCSRPIVDAKWLGKERQVGNSGKTVKPKVYLALGISGAFQHLAGLKGNPYIVAVNKNPKAPIFQVADVGVITDILDFIPELTERMNEIKK